MDDKRQKLFNEYIEHLFASGKSYNHVARYIKVVKSFLESGMDVNRIGYKRYLKQNAIYVINENLTHEALCDLLNFIGKGYSKKPKTEKIVPLVKLTEISERNMKLLNDFIYSLTQDEDYSPHTLDVYAFSLKKYFQYANEVSVDNYKRFVKSLEDGGYSPQTIRLRITALERFSDFIKKPIRLKRPKYVKKLSVENIPTEAEYLKLLQFLSGKKNKDYYFFVKILGTTGARVSEFLKLKWEDVARGEVILRGKGNKYRRIFFNKSLREEVSRYMEETGKTGYLARGKCGLITTRGLDSNLKTWGMACGIDKKKMHPHAFRHFFAKMYLKKSKDVVQLADLLGHGSIDTTRIYLQKSYDEQKREFDKSVTW